MKNDDGIITLIQSKVPLYKNKTYFKIFKDVLIGLTMLPIKDENNNIIIKLSKNKSNDKVSINNSYENNSLWFKIMKNIFINIKIKNYEFKKKLLIKNKFNPKIKDEFEDDYCYDFYNRKNNQYEISKLEYLYLANISKIKLQKLNFISQKEKIPLVNIIKIYFGLCAKNIGLLKIKQKKDDDEKNNENTSKKLLLRGFTLIDDDDNKKDKTLKFKKPTNESKLFNNVVKIKYISNLKNKLAHKISNKLINSKNSNFKENERNNSSEKNKKEESNNNSFDKKEENKNSFEDDLINDEFFKSIKNLNGKNKNSLKILYSSSFTRLFIGEVDIASIKERYMSIIDAKKEEKIGKKNKKSSLFLRIIQNGNNQLPLIKKNMKNVWTKFMKNQEIIEKFKRINLEEKEEKKNKDEKINYTDRTDRKRFLTSAQFTKNVLIKNELDFNIDITKKNNFISLSSKINKIIKTPERKKEIIEHNNKDDIIKNKINKKDNSSFKKRGIKNFFKPNDNNKNFINEYAAKKVNINEIKIKKNLFYNSNKNYLLTERNNSSKKSNFKRIFEEKLFRNKQNENMHFKALSLKNNNYRGERNLYGKLDKSKNQKTINFFTKKDFYF